MTNNAYSSALSLICQAHGISAREIARRLGKSHTLISKYFAGSTPFPDDFNERLKTVCPEFSPKEISNLETLFGSQTKRVEIGNAPPKKRKMIVQFASNAKSQHISDHDAAVLAALISKFSELPEDQKKAIEDMVGQDAIKSMLLARQRRSADFSVPFRSSSNIEFAADKLRKLAGLEYQKRVCMIELLDSHLPRIWSDFSYSVSPRSEILRETGELVEAYSNPFARRITISGEVFAHLKENKSTVSTRRARFTIAHEIGHLCLHDPVARFSSPPNRESNRSGDPEFQADKFAGALLFPRKYARQFSNLKSAQETFDMTESAVSAVLSSYSRPSR